MSRYILFNKPFGVLSQFTPEVAGQRTLSDFGMPPDVYSAGRLDRDSEGLLLLTDDGPFTKRLLQPGTGHERTYWVQVEGAISNDALHELARGVEIGDYMTLPAKATRMDEPTVWDRDPPIRFRASIPTSWIELILVEGKNRQVRRMTAAVGFPTLRLIRSAIGSVGLNGLQPGQWRELQDVEVSGLKDTREKANGLALKIRSRGRRL